MCILCLFLFSFGSVPICGLLLLLASLGSGSSYVSAQQFLLKRSNEFSLWKSSKREACVAFLCSGKFAEMREFSVAETKTIGLVSKAAAAAALNLYLLHTSIWSSGFVVAVFFGYLVIFL